MTLHPDFLRLPLAHRGLHGAGVPENSLEAVRAAAAAGYGIEIDVQLTADGEAVVFHDETLDRMTEAEGPVAARPLAGVTALRLRGGGTIPTLPQVLEAVAGRVPLLVEIKDQDGALGPMVGPLERAVADAVHGYDGPLALMSFNPHAAEALRAALPGASVGLTTCAFDADDWPDVPAPRLAELARIDADAAGADFVSHGARDLGMARIAELKAAGLPVLCWTIRSPEAERAARRIADNVTFEGYRPALDGRDGRAT